MKILRAVTGIVVLFTSLAAAETVVRELPARPGGLIEFDLDAGGAIKISGWDDDSIRVLAEVTGRDADIVNVSVENRGGRAIVKTKFAARRKHKETYVEIEVKVPREFDVKVDSDGGGVMIDGVEGTFSGVTQGGSIRLTNVKAYVDLKTRGGSLSLTDSEIEGSVRTLGGMAMVENVLGNVEVTSAGGQVTRRRVTRTDGRSIGEQFDIRSNGGDVKLPDAPHGAAIHTGGGEIHVGSARVFVTAETEGGDIRLDEVDGRVRATTNSGDVFARVVGSHDVELASLQGEVRLVLPDAVDPQIEIQLEYTRNSSRDYRIVSDFHLEIHESDRWAYGAGSARKITRGFTPGSGMHVLIRAVNGNIYLTR
jgi:hypothetical protein